MKKSNGFSSKTVARKDLLNSFSPFTIVAITLFALFLIYGTLAPYATHDHKLVTELSELIAGGNYKYCFAMNEAEFFPLLAPFIIAICQFAFLHQKDNCYTLLSFGIKREQLYKNRMAMPLIAMVVITLAIKGIALGLNIHHLYFSPDILEAWLIHITIYLQTIVFIYSITVFCCHMCGRTVEAIAASLSFIALPVALSYFVKYIFDYSLYGYAYNGENLLSAVIDFINPIALEDYITSAEHYVVTPGNDLSGRAVASLVWLVVSIALLVFTKKYFVKKYKPEISGFKGAKTAMVYVISLTAPMFIAYVAFDYVRGYYYPFINEKVKITAFIVAIAAGIVGAILCNFVVHFTFKRIKVALAAGLSIGAVAGITILIGLTGIFGTYNKLPDVSEIESVNFTAPFENFISEIGYSESIISAYPVSGEDIYITEEKDIEQVLDIHKQILNDRAAQSVTSMVIEYNLKDGTIIRREYEYISDSALEKCLQLWESEAVRTLVKGHLIPEKVFEPHPDDEFVGNVHTVFTDETSIEISSKHNVTTNVTELLTQEQSLELRNAVQKDILAMSYEEWFRPTADVLGTIYFTTVTDTHLGFSQYYYSNSFSFVAPVYETMKNTLAVLNKYGLTDELTAQRKVTKLYIADFKELVKWGSNASLKLADSEYLINPYFNNMNFYSLEQLMLSDAPIKEITDKAEIEKYIKNGQSFYLIGNNNATYVMAEFEEAEKGKAMGACYLIPQS